MLKRLIPALILFCAVVCGTPTRNGSAAADDYDIGSPTLRDVWVSTSGSNETGDGLTRATAFRTLAGAWNSLPSGALSGTGYRIRLTPGEYHGAYLEDIRGTAQFPVLIEPADGPGTVTFTAPYGEQGAVQFLNVAYVYLQDLVIDLPFSGDGFQCERCDHLLLRRMTVRAVRPDDGQTETVKLNQSQHVYIEDSDFSGAGDNALDAVAVQYGHVKRSKIHNARDWCAYFKGGSAYIRLEGNEFYDCGTGGFTSGQGTGFQFMTSPWLHYEAYGITFVNNVVHDVEGACMGVNGGYNIVYAYNTCVRVGQRSHVIEVVFGSRSCDGGDAANCQPRLDVGGWGHPDFAEALDIPNRHVWVMNNLVYNPAPYQSQWQHFDVRGPTTIVSGSNLPAGAAGDDDLHIVNNVIWNGPVDWPLGVGGSACTDANPTCNAAQLTAQNDINEYEPQMQSGSFVPLTGGNLLSVTTVAPPTLSWADAPSTPAVPAGDAIVSVPIDRAGRARCGGVGAYIVPDAAPCVLPPTATPDPVVTPTATSTLHPTVTATATPDPVITPTATSTLHPTVTATATPVQTPRVWVPLMMR